MAAPMASMASPMAAPIPIAALAESLINTTP
jgi:hypothetical protein